MRIFLLPTAVAVLELLAPSVASATVVAGPVRYGGSNYYMLSKQSWTSAEAEAITLGGHLVTVNAGAENTFLVSAFVLNGHSGDPLWLGLNDAVVEGTFVWSSGEPVTFANWQSGEPNNALGNEDYGTINWHFAQGITSDHSTWNDNPLNGTVGYGGTTDGPYFGIVEVVTGDYNDNGILDAPDYVLWRTNPIAYHGTPLGYNIWRQSFGSGVGMSAVSAIAVPEPTGYFLLFVVSICTSLRRSPRLRVERAQAMHGCRPFVS